MKYNIRLVKTARGPWLSDDDDDEAKKNKEDSDRLWPKLEVWGSERQDQTDKEVKEFGSLFTKPKVETPEGGIAKFPSKTWLGSVWFPKRLPGDKMQQFEKDFPGLPWNSKLGQKLLLKDQDDSGVQLLKRVWPLLRDNTVDLDTDLGFLLTNEEYNPYFGSYIRRQLPKPLSFARLLPFKAEGLESLYLPKLADFKFNDELPTWNEYFKYPYRRKLFWEYNRNEDLNAWKNEHKWSELTPEQRAASLAEFESTLGSGYKLAMRNRLNDYFDTQNNFLQQRIRLEWDKAMRQAMEKNPAYRNPGFATMPLVQRDMQDADMTALQKTYESINPAASYFWNTPYMLKGLMAEQRLKNAENLLMGKVNKKDAELAKQMFALHRLSDAGTHPLMRSAIWALSKGKHSSFADLVDKQVTPDELYVAYRNAGMSDEQARKEMQSLADKLVPASLLLRIGNIVGTPGMGKLAPGTGLGARMLHNAASGALNGGTASDAFGGVGDFSDWLSGYGTNPGAVSLFLDQVRGMNSPMTPLLGGAMSALAFSNPLSAYLGSKVPAWALNTYKYGWMYPAQMNLLNDVIQKARDPSSVSLGGMAKRFGQTATLGVVGVPALRMTPYGFLLSDPDEARRNQQVAQQRYVRYNNDPQYHAYVDSALKHRAALGWQSSPDDTISFLEDAYFLKQVKGQQGEMKFYHSLIQDAQVGRAHPAVFDDDKDLSIPKQLKVLDQLMGYEGTGLRKDVSVLDIGNSASRLCAMHMLKGAVTRYIEGNEKALEELPAEITGLLGSLTKNETGCVFSNMPSDRLDALKKQLRAVMAGQDGSVFGLPPQQLKLDMRLVNNIDSVLKDRAAYARANPETAARVAADVEAAASPEQTQQGETTPPEAQEPSATVVAETAGQPQQPAAAQPPAAETPAQPAASPAQPDAVPLSRSPEEWLNHPYKTFFRGIESDAEVADLGALSSPEHVNAWRAACSQATRTASPEYLKQLLSSKRVASLPAEHKSILIEQLVSLGAQNPEVGKTIAPDLLQAVLNTPDKEKQAINQKELIAKLAKNPTVLTDNLSKDEMVQLAKLRGRMMNGEMPAEQAALLEPLMKAAEQHIEVRAKAELKKNWFKGLPWMANLWALRNGWNGLAGLLGNPIGFYGTLLVLLGAIGLGAGIFVGGGDADAS